MITLQRQVESFYPKGRCCICVCCNSVYWSCLTEVSWSIVTHKNTSAQDNNHCYGSLQKYSKIQRVWLFTFMKEYSLQSRIAWKVDEFTLREQWSLILKYLELKIHIDVLRGGNSIKIFCNSQTYNLSFPEVKSKASWNIQNMHFILYFLK